ncbi:MAG: T9SS type A sorting domain-containing protein [bacterium]
MKNLSIILFLLLLSTNLNLRAIPRAPEDFMGRVTIPTGVEVEVLKFKTDQIVYAGTNGAGLYVSYDGGTKWVKLTTFPIENPCIKDIIIAPNKDLYVATFGEGIYYSKDNAATWAQKNNGLKNLYVQALTVTNKGKVICGTYGGGIYYSDDNGDNWTRTDKGLRNDNVTCLLYMRNGRILAGTAGGGVYASRDTCKSWVLSNTELKNYFLNDFAEDESGKIYAATNGGGVMFSGDGMTWNTYPNNYHHYQLNDIGPLLDTAVVAVGVNRYQMLMGTRSAGMYFWDDIWNCWQNTGEFALGITACAVSPNGTILATRTLGDVTRSTDNGEHWTICAKKITEEDKNVFPGYEDQLNLYTSDYDNSLILFTKTGYDSRKVYKSINHGNDWTYLSTFRCRKINDVEITPEGNMFIAADEGLYGSIDGGKTFNKLLTVPEKKEKYWEFNFIEYDTLAKKLVATFTYLVPDTITQPPGIPKPYLEFDNRLYVSNDFGASWVVTDYGITALDNLFIDKESNWYMNQNENFVKSIDHGLSYQHVFIKPSVKLVYGKDGNQYYYNTSDNKIYYTQNFSSTWKQINFKPDILVPNYGWSIKNIEVDLYGDFFVSIQISTSNQGILYELYTASNNGMSWQAMKGCYNMDRVRGICTDYSGYTYIWTNALYKVLNRKALQPPVIIAPKDGQKGEEINPIMSWKTVPLAEEYELQFDQIEEFPDPFEINVTGDSVCKVVLNLFYGSDFYWRIRSKTHSARSKWTEKQTFTIGLEPPILISPEKGKVSVPRSAELVWHKIVGSTNYQIQVAEDENFDKLVFEQNNYPDTTITTSKLNGLTKYYWRVKAFTKDNVSRWSEVWNFRTVMGPPKLIYPENNSIDKQLSEQFNWHKSAEALTYFIQVAKDSAFTDLFFEGSTGADTFKIIDNMLAETEYYWHVSSVNSEGTSDYSDIWTFSTSLKAVELIYPENQKVNVPIDAKFTWMEHVAGSEFQIQISKEVDFKTTVDDQIVKNILEFQTNKLEYYKNYFWRVRLVVGQRFGLWSEIRSFKSGIQSANLLNPPDKSKDQSTTIKFRWYEVIGSKFYQLQISKNELFTDMVYSMDSLTKTEQYVEELEPEILYYWRVRAWNEESFGTSQWSNVWTFTTGKVTLVLRNPKTGSTGVNIPTLLLWFPATTAEYYNLQVATDEDFVNVIFDKDSIVDTKWTLSKADLEVSTDYFWRVKGVSKQYTTPWSETWHYTTAATSVKECELFSSIKLYPNPTGNNAELIINYAETCDAKIQITTAEGKIIKTDPIRLSQGETRYEINAEHLTSGTYYITIITPSGFITRELVVIK